MAIGRWKHRICMHGFMSDAGNRGGVNRGGTGIVLATVNLLNGLEGITEK